MGEECAASGRPNRYSFIRCTALGAYEMALFKLGHLRVTPAALQLCRDHRVGPLTLLARHSGGDWGTFSAENVAANVHALQHDLRILSTTLVGNEKQWVITEADRSSTRLLLPREC